MSFTNELTALKNMRKFEEQIHYDFHQAQRANHSISILITDLDYFKQVNDINGHLVGNECLIDVAKLLASSFDRHNDCCARIGGDEFAVILNSTSHNDIISIAKIILQKICELDYKISASIGLCTMFPEVIAIRSIYYNQLPMIFSTKPKVPVKIK